MSSVDPDREIKDVNYALLVAPNYDRTNKKSLNLTIEFYQRLKDYMNDHPEYYDCSMG